VKSTQILLDRLASMPVTTWRYTDGTDDSKHMGPMAQDFYQTFQLGASDRRIQVVDGLGVSLASIQALYRKMQALEAENSALRSRDAGLEQRLAALEASASRRESALPTSGK
jgi:hypothetical protein